MTVADHDPTGADFKTDRGAGPRSGPILTLVGVILFAATAGTCAITPGLVERPALQPAYALLVMLSFGGAALTVIGLVLTVVELLAATLRRR